MKRTVEYKGNIISLHTGNRRLNKKRWWYTARLISKERRFVFKAFDKAGASTALEKAKSEIDRLPHEEIACFHCSDIGSMVGYMLADGWGHCLDSDGFAQYCCASCMSFESG